MSAPAAPCPVCEAPHTHPLMAVQSRHYWRCLTCEATFLQPDQRPTREEEQRLYAQHHNSASDGGYLRFLQRLSTPLLQRLAPGQQGLDYGCGPGPVLADLLRAHGHEVALYDPFFQPETTVLQRRYGFITCTEAIEHFHQPAAEFRRLDALLQPGGWLALMTCFQTDDARFAQWHYRRDPTHVVFYRAHTLQWLAQRHGWNCEIPCKDVALMHKRAAVAPDA